MISTPAIAEPALGLRRHLESGGLLTPWAEARCGQRVSADVTASRPPRLFREEARTLGIGAGENWACLRRGGLLAQEDGTSVARVTSVVALSQLSPEECRLLQKTRTPLGTVLGEAASTKLLWCSVGICEFAVACGRLILRDGQAVAMTTDWVLWSWLGQVSEGGAA